MKKFRLLPCCCLALMLASCAALFPLRETPPEPVRRVIPERVPERPDITEVPEREIPDIRQEPRRHPIPEYIMGTGIIHPVDKAAFLLNSNPGANVDFVEALAIFYAEEAAIEGVNHDIAFAQMILETGFLSFGGLVTLDMNNFAGLGSMGPGQHGLWFPTPRTGVRAHIQHLKAYACTEPLNQEAVTPHFHLVTRGTAPTISGLAGTWDSNPLYGEKLKDILERMYDFTFGTFGF
ncbi:MAG: glucosaminidase domain-containing protein [Treponema sp.]|nr:glucosaminidase domain-containing protein [Treponema sp.]